MRYHPNPIDTSGITLPQELDALVELLAENVHDQWALGRIAEGWVYGPQRNDQTKEHPCLVPYGELPDSEKEYDRTTAMETVKIMVKLGYRITRD